MDPPKRPGAIERRGGERIDGRVRIGEVESHYWGEPFTPPPWRATLSMRLDMPSDEAWPAADRLRGD